MPNFEAIEELLNDINQLQLTISYCEKKIVRKRIAIEELMSSSRDDSKPVPRGRPSAVRAEPGDPSLIDLVISILPDIGPVQFRTVDVVQLLKLKHPETPAKGVSFALWKLVNRRILKRISHGKYQHV